MSAALRKSARKAMPEAGIAHSELFSVDKAAEEHSHQQHVQLKADEDTSEMPSVA